MTPGGLGGNCSKTSTARGAAAAPSGTGRFLDPSAKKPPSFIPPKNPRNSSECRILVEIGYL